MSQRKDYVFYSFVRLLKADSMLEYANDGMQEIKLMQKWKAYSAGKAHNCEWLGAGDHEAVQCL